jgi:hypothetical protein
MDIQLERERLMNFERWRIINSIYTTI